MAFHVGQKVVCVDDIHRTFKVKHPCLKVGEIYIVAGFGPTFAGVAGIHLMDVINLPSWQAFYQERFRPVVEKKTDISIFTEMLKPRELVRLND